MPHMTRLLPDLQAYFPRVETVPGWATRGSDSFAPAVVVCHWTAGPRGSTNRPSLGVVTSGRPGLSGPLCNVYLARDGVPVIVAAGRANHAGAGGWRGVVGNSGAYGIEAEAADGADWTPAQRAAYPRLVAAMLRGLGRDASWACGHAEWATPAGRKTDINGWPMDAMRAQVAAHLRNPQEAEMNDDERRLLQSVADTLRIVHDTLTPGVAGVKFDGEVYGKVKYLPEMLQKIYDETPDQVWAHPVGGLRPGPDGKPVAGDLPAWQRLSNASSAAGGQVDVAALAAALRPTIVEVIRSAPSAGADDLAKRVADTLAARLAA